MRKLKFFTYCTLLVTTPALFAYPQHSLPRATASVVNYEPQQNTQEWTRPTTYDEIMIMLDELESGEFKKKYSPTQLEQVNEYLAILAKEGILPNEFDEEMVLEEDIEDLLNGEDSFFEYAYSFGISGQYMIIPAVFNDYGHYDVIRCGWISKNWKKTKKFVKKHKKEIIIGAVVVVAVAVVAIAVVAAAAPAAATAAAGAAGAAAASGSGSGSSSGKSESGKADGNSSATYIPSNDAPILKSAIEEQISSFKENIAQEQFFQPQQGEGLSWEETGRVLGPLFAHESFNNLNNQVATYPQFSQEIQNISSQANFSLPSEASNAPVDFGHNEIDRRFSADYASLFSDPGKETDFSALSYQMRGEKALAFGYYNQAVNDLSNAIELNPTNSIPYLERGEAHFRLGNYDRCLEDFHTFTQQTSQELKIDSLSVSEFSLGFAKGLPKGMYESGHGILLLLSDIVIHPIHTGEQMWDSLKLLSNLARSEEWGIFAEVLAPEVHQLVTQWDTLPSDVRGELAGHAFGKYGADILIPGALAKAVSKGMKGAKELSAISRSLRTSERTFLMESVSGLESGAKIAEVVQLEKRVSGWLGEGTRFIRNEAGDSVFLSKDGLRRVRFDFKNPSPHHNPHSHVEIKVNGDWIKSGPIYPTDIPYN